MSNALSAVEQLQKEAADKTALTAVTLDVADDASIEVAAKGVPDQLGRLDSLISNVGLGQIPEASSLREQFCQIFEVNMFGVAAVTEAFLPLARTEGVLGRKRPTSSKPRPRRVVPGNQETFRAMSQDGGKSWTKPVNLHLHSEDEAMRDGMQSIISIKGSGNGHDALVMALEVNIGAVVHIDYLRGVIRRRCVMGKQEWSL
ncbi:hypothetical protein F4818DRAFT_454248 [Hypoxylon cercidicola]|nr:hypothetical protein F4818DRAFT_454248 [Hypoxylon cercidicola]